MGREVRRVPADWEHPLDNRGSFKPLHEGFKHDLDRWNYWNQRWIEGYVQDYGKPFEENHSEPKTEEHLKLGSYSEYDGDQPKQEDYMPDWPEEQRTHLQMYETCSEGTPISPVMATKEELARWLADNGASSFGDMTATYEQWLAMIGEDYAPSAVWSQETGLVSGVEAVASFEKKK